MTDTIFARSSGSTPSAIAILRISGPAAFAGVERIAGTLPPPRRAGLRRLIDPASGIALDRGLVVTFPGPDSATGEDVAELHVHGSTAVVRAVEATLSTLPSFRPAEAGEFTRRALIAGRIDLTEAEGLADLLAAETEGQRRAALRASEGHIRRLIEDWSDRVVHLSAMVEAAIDYSDEEDAADEGAIVTRVRAGAMALADAIGAVVGQPAVERLRDGIRVVLAGPPNSGKSTLFNALIGRDAAIVSPIAGTTRDRIEAPVVSRGAAWLITDTAGLVEQTDDPIEAIGVARARESLAAADITLWLGDAAPEPSGSLVIAVHARSDVPGREGVPAGRIGVSSATGGGIAAIWDELESVAATMLPPPDSVALNHRQRSLCGDAVRNLCDAAVIDDLLIVAEELRVARLRLDQVTGRAGLENVLDAIFGQFCIGK